MGLTESEVESGTELATLSQLGRLLGVDRRQVWQWHERRRKNGFPEKIPDPTPHADSDPRWSVSEVLAWRETYVPNRGGRPSASVVGGEEDAVEVA